MSSDAGPSPSRTPSDGSGKPSSIRVEVDHLRSFVDQIGTAEWRIAMRMAIYRESREQAQEYVFWEIADGRT